MALGVQNLNGWPATGRIAFAAGQQWPEKRHGKGVEALEYTKLIRKAQVGDLRLSVFAAKVCQSTVF
ncbi:hypothetical protein [Larkinella rosea]|uniref:Uncharacterized protein n=1 Tax=Larkinella rosea TaxID=2025312 RepID=A0A3P1BZI9_9BACT|nr:hypothetical protein [Larkinella rosea]RRB06276.1 hypothetical protein EHT25_00270 [Larkinella rosea]